MPDIQYDSTQPTTATKKRFSLPSFSLKGFGRFLLLLVITIVTYLLAAILTGVISALSTNIDVTAVSIIFDPQITIAYILVYYSTNHFHKFSSKQSYTYLLFTLFLSFTTNFIQGSLVMLTLPPVLTKLKLITPQAE